MKIQTEAKRSRQNTYALVNLALDTGDEAGYKAALKRVDEHNAKYPGMEITVDNLVASVNAFQKRSSEMLGGVYIEKNLRPFFAPLLEE